MKVLSAEIAHESNTFSCRKTDEQAFRDCYLLFGSEAQAKRGEANTELAGFLKFGNNHDWQIEHVLSASADPSGKVTRQAFEFLCEPVITAVRSNCDNASRTAPRLASNRAARSRSEGKRSPLR